MGQTEIQKLLEISIRPLTLKEISIILDREPKKIADLIRSMLKYNEVNFLEIDKDTALKKYGCKHKMRLYFIENSREKKTEIGIS